MLPEIRLPSLRGLGDRWENDVRQRFGREANNYVAPDSFEFAQSRSLVREIRDAVSGQAVVSFDKLDEQARQLGLTLSQVKTDTGEFVLLQELKPRGWGQVLFRVNGSDPTPNALIVEIPHPGFDGGTPELGMEIFEQSHGDVLLMAGAHRLNRPEPSPEQPERRLSDPAHSSATFFQAAHEGLQGPGQTVLQVHGFSARTPHDPQVVLSDGQDDQYDPPALLNLNRALQEQGLTTGVVDFQEDWLTARTNLQGQAMAQSHLLGPTGPSQFVHVEFDQSLRKGPQRQQSFDKILRAVEHWPFGNR